MKQRPTRPHKLGEFMEGKGYYIVLFLCIAAIGISGYFLFRGLFAQPEGFGETSTAAVSGQAKLDRETGESDPTAQTTPSPAAPAEKPAEKEPAETPAAPAQETPDVPPEEAAESSAYVWPVEGSIDRDFSLEVFAYDATMGDWRTHDGLDIAAPLGTPVASCAKGTVKDVSHDDMMGMTVTIDHGKGMESLYANLAETVEVQPGAAVEPGTVIGTVGTSATAESAGPSHLHFALREYGVLIDPMNYLH